MNPLRIDTKTYLRRGLLLFWLVTATAAAADHRIIMLAGAPSHRPGFHEYRAGLLLFQKCLAGFPGVSVEVDNYDNAWVRDESVLDGASAVVIYSDGGPEDPLFKDDRLGKIGALMRRGVGLGLIHFSLEATKEKGEAELIDWAGGAYETYYSVNPIWQANFLPLPAHPVTRGVQPYSMRDEWYFHIRFRDGMAGITPILMAVPPVGSVGKGETPHHGNASARVAVQNREPQVIMWAAERPDGGRGFGFTGGHTHAHWADDNQRKLVLNAILWIAKAEVPPNGVESKVTAEEMMANLDRKPALPSK